MLYNKLIFNKQTYAVSVMIQNKHELAPIPANRILSFMLVEEMYSIFPTGKMVLDSTGNLLDQTPSMPSRASLLTKHTREVGTADPTYAFNTDNRDMIFVDMFPVVSDWFHKDDDKIFPEDEHRLYYEFYIIDEEESLEDDGKQKILHLRDAREQTLVESRVPWTSSDALAAEVGHNINFSQVSNELRSPRTGEAIKHFIKAALPMTNTFADWDKGDTTTFYSALPGHSSYDTLEGLLDIHVSSGDADNCVLGLERTSRGAGDWFLRPLNKFYSNAVNKVTDTLGKYTVDIFHVTSGGSKGGSATKPIDKIPLKGFAAIARNEVIQQFDGLENFTYLNMPNGPCLQDLVTTITHGYNFAEKQFDIDCEHNHIGRIRDKFDKLYVKDMMGDSPTPVFPVESQRLENKNVQHVYSPGNTTQKRKKDGVNRVLNKALAYAPGIDFAVPGNTRRQPGRFIILADSTLEPGSAFEKIISGEWFMVKIVHMFNFAVQNYQQQISCTKSHTHSVLSPLNDDDVAAITK